LFTQSNFKLKPMSVIHNNKGRRDHMVVGYKTTYAISAYHH